MPNLFQYLSNEYKTLKQPMKQVQGKVQGDKNLLFKKDLQYADNLPIWFLYPVAPHGKMQPPV